MLLRTQAALTNAGNSGLFESVDGSTQLQADLTTIKSLAESLLGKLSGAHVGSASDPNHVSAVGSLTQPEQQSRLDYFDPTKHGS